MKQLPDEELIRVWALEDLPEHYKLESVRLTFSGGLQGIVPDDFEITIEYVNHVDEVLRGTETDIKSHQDWASPLEKRIREKWGSKEWRIGFVEKYPD